MQNQNQAEALVFKAIDRVNDVLLDENAVPKEAGTILVGPGAVLDSMGFVNFIVALEEVVAQEMGLNISLTEALNARDSGVPAAMTISDLAGFLCKLAQGKEEKSAGRNS